MSAVTKMRKSKVLRRGDGGLEWWWSKRMTYRGIVSNGVVVLEGEKPRDGTMVEVTPVGVNGSGAGDVSDHPAIGIWKDRDDLPADAVEASKVLRQRMMRRADE